MGLNHQPITIEAILLMRSYVTQDLFNIFQAHFNTYKNISNILLPFLQITLVEIKTKVWKTRSMKWKDWKRTHGPWYYQTSIQRLSSESAYRAACAVR
ncbi:unnamed protein product [Rhizophagus irregularis]|nr:unnamed protein product [Rhizophagus irregularis]